MAYHVRHWCHHLISPIDNLRRYYWQDTSLDFFNSTIGTMNIRVAYGISNLCPPQHGECWWARAHTRRPSIQNGRHPTPLTRAHNSTIRRCSLLNLVPPTYKLANITTLKTGIRHSSRQEYTSLGIFPRPTHRRLSGILLGDISNEPESGP